MKTRLKICFLLILLLAILCVQITYTQDIETKLPANLEEVKFRSGEPTMFSRLLTDAALERTSHQVIYDGSYRRLKYPGGDVADGFGVCTDVVIRAYRKLGVDLQKDVHLDMRAAFSKYPKNWGLKRTDTNIDHRRVPNLQKFFSRKGISFKVSSSATDYFPGDLVTWMLPGNLPHIGIVTSKLSEDRLRPLVVHNIGQGPKLEDMLFAFKITGHYRYYGSLARKAQNVGKNRSATQTTN